MELELESIYLNECIEDCKFYFVVSFLVISFVLLSFVFCTSSFSTAKNEDEKGLTEVDLAVATFEKYWKPLFDVIYPFCKANGKDDKEGEEDSQETDSFHVMTFRYVIEVIELLEKCNNSKMESKNTKSMGEKKIVLFMCTAWFILLGSLVITVAQLACVCRIAAYCSDTYYGPLLTSKAIVFIAPLPNQTRYNGCGQVGFESDFCTSKTPSLMDEITHKQFFSQLSGSICITMNKLGNTLFKPSIPGLSILFKILRHSFNPLCYTIQVTYACLVMLLLQKEPKEMLHTLHWTNGLPAHRNTVKK